MRPKPFLVPVLLLSALALGGLARANTYYVSPAGDDGNDGSSAAPWRTLQKAANSMTAGDVTLLADGEYAGGLVQTVSGAVGKPITFRAVNPGSAIVRGDQTANPDGILVQSASYVLFDAITVTKSARAGIRVDHGNNVTIRRCHLLDNGKSGISITFSDDALIEFNECARSASEHGIQAGESGDRPVIRYNKCHDNALAGIQLDADPAAGGDGYIDGASIEGNTLYNNGASGGAAIDVDGARTARVVNNLLYDNLATGIRFWDNGAGPAYGCLNGVVLNNTVHFHPGQGGRCMAFLASSTGNVSQNNIFDGGLCGAYDVDSTSSFASDYNVLRQFGGTEAVYLRDSGSSEDLATWQASGNDLHSLSANPLFSNPAVAPYDFRLVTTSPALHTGIGRSDVTSDILGSDRPTITPCDMGCYEASIIAKTPVAPTDVNGLPKDGALEVHWTPTARAQSYTIKRGAIAKGPFTVVGMSDVPVFTETGLPNGVAAFYVVTASNSAGTSVNSKASAAATPTNKITYAFFLSAEPKILTGGSTTTGTLYVSDSAPAGGLTYSLSSSNATLARVPASVTVPAGASSVSFPIVTRATGSSSFVNVTLTAARAGAKKSYTITLTPSSLASVSLSASTVMGGVPLVGSVELSGPAPDKGLVVSLSSDTDLVAPKTVKVLPGSRVVSFDVTTKSVALPTVDALVGSDGSTFQGTLVTVTPPLKSLAILPTLITMGGTATGTVTLNGQAPAGGLTITLSDNSAITGVPASITIPAGEVTGTFTISSVASGTQIVTSTITAALGAVSTTAQLTLDPQLMFSMTVSPTSVVGGSQNAMGTVTLVYPAPAGGATITLKSSNTSAATVPATVVVPGGSTTASFPITTLKVTANTSASISGTLGVTRSAGLKVTK